MTMELCGLSWTGIDNHVGVFLFQTEQPEPPKPLPLPLLVSVGGFGHVRTHLNCLSSNHNWLQPVSELPLSPHLWGTLRNSHPLGKAAGAEERRGTRARAPAPQLSPLSQRGGQRSLSKMEALVMLTSSSPAFPSPDPSRGSTAFQPGSGAPSQPTLYCRREHRGGCVHSSLCARTCTHP